MKEGELTSAGFVKLIELEAEDAQGDSDDLWLALEAMGYDRSLVQHQVYYGDFIQDGKIAIWEIICFSSSVTANVTIHVNDNLSFQNLCLSPKASCQYSSWVKWSKAIFLILS